MNSSMLNIVREYIANTTCCQMFKKFMFDFLQE